jgi:ADP-heptose:LPS heptosyltransferase
MGPTINSILVYVGLDRVGDGVMKLPFLRALRGAYPQARITWLAGQGKSEFAGSLRPLTAGLIDEVIDQAGIGGNWRGLFGRPLAGRRFDLVLDTQRRLLTTLIVKRIRHGCFVSGAADGLFSDRKPPRGWKKPKAMVRQMLELVELASGEPARLLPDITLPPDLRAAAEQALPAGPLYVGLAPGAGGKHKCWPLDRFIALGRRQQQAGRVAVVFLGPEEMQWEEGLRAGLPAARFPLRGDAPPPLTIALAGRLAAAVANDSGTGHMLAAGGAPMVSLFGPTPPEKFAPTAARLRIVRAQAFGGDTMAAIPLDAVSEALEDLLSGS